ncbi:hypothetical protein N7462_000818 [Penicillium macrosclerotiorum]|uniref:uncharacterized protein n=1 Tax=Penicillium macrosclerotiorum TaxID=303699 RepID=UPI002546BB2E|nr:uncharacterized protein N7462_000818 [Penicillium macrosclerotiorum]KAJ5698813.1 hypothetical protein N7462_000818 [Penicillium macrosclerotiorum]
MDKRILGAPTLAVLGSTENQNGGTAALHQYRSDVHWVMGKCQTPNLLTAHVSVDLRGQNEPQQASGWCGKQEGAGVGPKWTEMNESNGFQRQNQKGTFKRVR